MQTLRRWIERVRAAMVTRVYGCDFTPWERFQLEVNVVALWFGLQREIARAIWAEVSRYLGMNVSLREYRSAVFAGRAPELIECVVFDDLLDADEVDETPRPFFSTLRQRAGPGDRAPVSREIEGTGQKKQGDPFAEIRGWH